ncbi:MAG: pyrroloquinoline quinone-dependent dehydrogenase [Alphaproteobacteria bacterium]
MKELKRGRVILTLAGALMASTMAVPAFAQVTQERLENAGAEPENWLIQQGNYSNWSYSSLDQINRDNVGDLNMAFALPISSAILDATTQLFGASQLENRPLVIDGMMYFSDAWGIIYKVDVTNPDLPRTLWVTDPAMDRESGNILITRGLAAFGGNIYANLPDGRVIGVDMETGEIVIDEQIARTEADWDGDIGEGFTAAPLAVENKILVGQSLGDWGTRGFLAAVDGTTGEELWRTYTVPGPGEFGHETWADEAGVAWHTGGGSLWQTGAYDPSTRLTIWGTANPVPMFDPEFRPGDNLFTNSALAFDVDDGSIAWYFQYTPNESWDFDEIGIHTLIPTEIDGEQRSIVSHYARNGYYYQMDAGTGEFIRATQYVAEVTWTEGIDEKTGLPLEYDPTLDLQTYIPETRGTRADPFFAFCPTALGGVRWQPTAYNPNTGLNYVSGVEGCTGIEVAPGEPAPGQIFLGGNFGAPGSTANPPGIIVAIDASTGQVVNRLSMPYQSLSGLLATAGGIIFHGGLDGRITAHDENTLEELWAFPTGITIKAAPMTYSVDGRQFIAVIAGSGGGGGGYPELANMQTGAMLYAFSLD